MATSWLWLGLTAVFAVAGLLVLLFPDRAFSLVAGRGPEQAEGGAGRARLLGVLMLLAALVCAGMTVWTWAG